MPEAVHSLTELQAVIQEARALHGTPEGVINHLAALVVSLRDGEGVMSTREMNRMRSRKMQQALDASVSVQRARRAGLEPVSSQFSMRRWDVATRAFALLRSIKATSGRKACLVRASTQTVEIWAAPL